MTCAIFCLLAVCALQTVFAEELPDDAIYTVKDECFDQISDVHEKYASDLWDAVNAVKVKGISTDHIYYKCTSNDFARKFSEKVITQLPGECDGCYEKAKNDKNIQSGKSCNKKLSHEIKKGAKLSLATFKTCVSKCAESAVDCRKEFKKIYQKTVNDMKIAKQDMNKSEKNKILDTDGSKRTEEV